MIGRNKKQWKFDVTKLNTSQVQILLNERCVSPLDSRPTSPLAKHGGSHKIDQVPRPQYFLAQRFVRIAPGWILVAVNPWDNLALLEPFKNGIDQLLSVFGAM